MKDVVIIGAGGHGKVVADIVKKSGDNVLGFLDDFAEGETVIGKVADHRKYCDKYFIIAIGNNEVRKKLSEEISGLKWYNAIHPSAVISENVRIGVGVVVAANAVINAGAVVGNHCIINTASVIEHDNNIADYCHVSPGAVLCGTVSVGECTHIGAAAVVKNNVKINKNIVVGVGSAVVKDLEESGTYIGVPARKMR